MEKGLEHILEVYRHVRKGYCSRVEAAKKVAKKGRIAYSTVMAFCTREISVDTVEFDKFLRPANAPLFRNYLIKRFPSSQDEIDDFFNEFDRQEDTQADRTIRPLFPDEKKHLYNELLLKEFRDKSMEWISRQDVPNDVKQYLKEWINKI